MAGAVFGALGLAEGITGACGGLVFNYIYAKTLWISPGFTFLVVGFFFGIGTAVLM